jgi:hypothetical protein
VACCSFAVRCFEITVYLEAMVFLSGLNFAKGATFFNLSACVILGLVERHARRTSELKH